MQQLKHWAKPRVMEILLSLKVAQCQIQRVPKISMAASNLKTNCMGEMIWQGIHLQFQYRAALIYYQVKGKFMLQLLFHHQSKLKGIEPKRETP